MKIVMAVVGTAKLGNWRREPGLAVVYTGVGVVRMRLFVIVTRPGRDPASRAG